MNIDRIDAPDKADFEARYVATGKPAIITGVIPGWKAFEQWPDFDYLKQKVGSNEVPVYLYQHEQNDGPWSEFGGVATKQGGITGAMIAMSRYIGMLDGTVEKKPVYMADALMSQFLPELLEDLEVPELIQHYKNNKPTDAPLPFLYFGKDNFTQNHMHMDNHALVCQVVGEKRMRLYSPDQTRDLYPWPLHSYLRGRNPFHSKVNVDQPDLTRFPRFAKTKPVEVTIKAGEMLYIPTFWWHVVYSPGLSMAVTFSNLNRPGWTSKYPYTGVRANTARAVMAVLNAVTGRKGGS